MPDTYLIGVCALQPRSRGSVRLAGRDPELAPIVDPNYLGDDRDMATMVRGFGIARAIGSAPALKAWRAEELAPGSVGGRRGVASRLHSRDHVVVLPPGGNVRDR